MEATLTVPHPRLRLGALLVALAVAGFLASLPFLWPLLAAGAAKVNKPIALLVVAQGLQLAVLCTLAAWAGIAFSRRAGLDAPVLRALAEHRPVPPLQWKSALLVGTLATAATLAALLAVRPWAPPQLWHAGPGASFWRGATSAFYGGIVEELLMRWGLLTGLMLLFRRNFWAANLATALIFGAGHLPAAFQMGLPMTPGLLAHVLLGNCVAGLFFGWLFRRHGLEAAMIAHAVADVWLHAALPVLT